MQPIEKARPTCRPTSRPPAKVPPAGFVPTISAVFSAGVVVSGVPLPPSSSVPVICSWCRKSQSALPLLATGLSLVYCTDCWDYWAGTRAGKACLSAKPAVFEPLARVFPSPVPAAVGPPASVIPSAATAPGPGVAPSTVPYPVAPSPGVLAGGSVPAAAFVPFGGVGPSLSHPPSLSVEAFVAFYRGREVVVSGRSGTAGHVEAVAAGRPRFSVRSEPPGGFSAVGDTRIRFCFCFWAPLCRNKCDQG